VLIAEAVVAIARLDLRPLDTKRSAETRTRERIWHALQTESLRLISDPEGAAVEHDEFCNWAYTKWGKRLVKLPGFGPDIAATPEAGQMSFTGHPPIVFVANLSDFEWLRENYPRVEAQRQLLAAENKTLREQVGALGTENERLRADLSRRKQVLSASGKKGGRGRNK
jgi:hypothetical protein